MGTGSPDAWDNAQLWWPDDPQLYHAVTDVVPGDVWQETKPFQIINPDAATKPSVAEGDLLVWDASGRVVDRLTRRGMLGRLYSLAVDGSYRLTVITRATRCSPHNLPNARRLRRGRRDLVAVRRLSARRLILTPLPRERCRVFEAVRGLGARRLRRGRPMRCNTLHAETQMNIGTGYETTSGRWRTFD